MSRTPVRRRRTTLAVCLVLVGAAWAGPAVRALTPDRPVRVARSAYVVRQGDTLWSIAASSYGGDPREGVWKLRERNHLDGTTIAPGQVLRLP